MIGAGSAGAVIAARLASRGNSVLLLEAGPDYESPSVTPPELLDAYLPAIGSHDWGFCLRGPANRVIAAPRGRVIGGSSAVNTCIALRPDPEDFAKWVTLGNPGWGWSDVLPFFIGLETDHDCSSSFHGTNGPVPVRRWQQDELLPLTNAFVAACQSEGYGVVSDLNEPGATGVGIVPMNRVGRQRVSIANAYLDPVRSRSNLCIKSRVHVDRVVVKQGAVVGVEFAKGGEYLFEAGERVTLCAGAYGSPCVLIRSGIGPAELLGRLGVPIVANLHGVGRGLQDHSQCFIPVIASPGSIAPGVPCIQTLLRFTSIAGSHERNDMQLCVLNWVDLPAFAPSLSNRLGSASVFMICTLVQKPESYGEVLVSSRGLHTPPLISLDYAAASRDLARYREGLRLGWRVAHSPEMAACVSQVIGLEAETVYSDDALDDYVRRQVQTAHHPVGTCRMGPASDPMAVVDHRCRVHGVSGLRIADASVMPSIVRANTNLTCAMIGERVAAWISSDS